MTSLHWEVRKYAHDLRPDGRLAVLVVLILHSNVRLRCWPSVDLLEYETGWGRASVVDAKQWLIDHGAIELVPHDKRVGDELELPPRQHIYQLTGVITVNGVQHPYLYLNPKETAPLPNSTVGESSVGESSPSEPKGIPLDQGIPEPKDNYAPNGAEPDLDAPLTFKTKRGPVKQPPTYGDLFVSIRDWLGTGEAYTGKLTKALLKECPDATALEFKRFISYWSDRGLEKPSGTDTLPKQFGIWRKDHVPDVSAVIEVTPQPDETAYGWLSTYKAAPAPIHHEPPADDDDMGVW